MSKIRITSIIPFYNEFKPLQRLLLHMSSMKISTIFCDGRFHRYQKLNDSDISKDGSRFLVTSYKNTILIDCDPCFIEEKINKLFQEAFKNDFTHVMLLGSDEYLEGDYDLFLNNLEKTDFKESTILKVPFVDHDEKFAKPESYIERIFYHPGDIIAKSINSFYHSSKPSQKVNSYHKVIEGISIHHDNSIRKKDRNDLMREYQKLIKEKKF